ncbi:nucleophile aminohydrolase, partial [Pavlovales sp. CCMP2436]
STAVGIKCVDGVVMAVEKSLISKMMVHNTHKRIFHLDEHVGMAVSGVQADARNVMNRGRSEATQYRTTYGDAIPGDVMTQRLAGYMHLHTMYWWLRPFGTSVLVGSYDDEGPQLHDIDPSGSSYRHFAAAVGKGKTAAKSLLEKLPLATITCRQAVIELAKIMYSVHDDLKEKQFEIEVSWVCDESGRKHTHIPAALLAEAMAAGKAAKDAE